MTWLICSLFNFFEIIYWANLLGYHQRSLQALRTFFHRKFHLLALFQAAETVCLDGRVMYEYILSTIVTDEAVAFCCIEPFDGPNYTI